MAHECNNALGGNVLGADAELVAARSETLRIAAESNGAAADGRFATHVVELIARQRIASGAMRAQPQGLACGYVVAPKVIDLCVEGNPETGGRAGQHRAHMNATAPATITAIGKLRELAKGSVTEIQLQVDRGIAQIGG